MASLVVMGDSFFVEMKEGKERGEEECNSPQKSQYNLGSKESRGSEEWSVGLGIENEG